MIVTIRDDNAAFDRIYSYTENAIELAHVASFSAEFQDHSTRLNNLHCEWTPLHVFVLDTNCHLMYGDVHHGLEIAGPMRKFSFIPV